FSFEQFFYWGSGAIQFWNQSPTGVLRSTKPKTGFTVLLGLPVLFDLLNAFYELSQVFGCVRSHRLNSTHFTHPVRFPVIALSRNFRNHTPDFTLSFQRVFSLPLTSSICRNSACSCTTSTLLISPCCAS